MNWIELAQDGIHWLAFCDYGDEPLGSIAE
jgi:hypothetical protein